ncbi:MAG: ATP-binding cassette domain-containing protein [Flavobacteriales bacterium]|nr:ATP-binding cassette domain-containing protein [Flavobacteriales bacterium]
MPLHLTNIAKKYNKNWVFRKVNIQFNTPGTYVIKGSNGSGKSTLLKIISGHLSASEGEQKLIINSKEIPIESWPEHIAYAAPYFELIENMYLEEFLEFYTKFKPLNKNITIDKFITITYLETSRNKQIKNFSSGMKQRLKLALAWLSDVYVVLLDEPCSNLDQRGIEWYKKMATKYSKDKLIIVCSNNIQEEFFFCENSLNIDDFMDSHNSQKNTLKSQT